MTTVTDWTNWLKFMRQEPNLFHREDWYAAKTIATIKATRGVKSSIKEELIEFSWQDKTQRRRMTLQETKLAWAAALGSYSAEIAQQIEDDHKNKG